MRYFFMLHKSPFVFRKLSGKTYYIQIDFGQQLKIEMTIMKKLNAYIQTHCRSTTW